MRKYQENYAAGRPQMYDKKSRKKKALRIVKTLAHFFGQKKIKTLTVLDVGASTGIIDNVLAKHFKKVVGTDIDSEAVKFAKKNFGRKNLVFKVDDAMKLSFKENVFDIVICTHVYEHVSDPKKLFQEIFRVLKPGGVCYLAAQNKLWPLEAHHKLLFLSYLPKNMADFYIKLFRDKKEYYEHPMTYWELQKLLRKYQIHEYTSKILSDPRTFGYENGSIGIIGQFAKYFTPTLFWLLEK